MADFSSAMDSKNQGMGQEFVDISKAMNDDQNKRNELTEMKEGRNDELEHRQAKQDYEKCKKGQTEESGMEPKCA